MYTNETHYYANTESGQFIQIKSDNPGSAWVEIDKDKFDSLMRIQELESSIINPEAGTSRYYIVTKNNKAVDVIWNSEGGHIRVLKRMCISFSTREEAEATLTHWQTANTHGLKPRNLSISTYAEGW